MKEEVLLCYNNSSLFCQEAQWAGRVVVAVLCSTRCIVALRRLELERGERGQTCGKTTGCHLSPCLNPGIPLYFIPGCCTLYKCGYNLTAPWLLYQYPAYFALHSGGFYLSLGAWCTSFIRTLVIILYTPIGCHLSFYLSRGLAYKLYFIHWVGVTWAPRTSAHGHGVEGFAN